MGGIAAAVARSPGQSKSDSSERAADKKKER